MKTTSTVASTAAPKCASGCAAAAAYETTTTTTTTTIEGEREGKGVADRERYDGSAYLPPLSVQFQAYSAVQIYVVKGCVSAVLVHATWTTFFQTSELFAILPGPFFAPLENLGIQTTLKIVSSGRPSLCLDAEVLD